MSEIDWSKAPKRYPLWLAFKSKDHHFHSGWYRKDGNFFKGYFGAHWPSYREGQFFDVYAKQEESLIIDGYLPPLSVKSPPWSGEGRPPVGAVCEAFYMGQPQGVVSVRYSGQCMILWSEDRKSEQCGQADDYWFKPIRTPEQIAADEREAAIKAACYAVEGQIEKYNTRIDCSAAIRATIEAMIDEGYKKP